MSHSIVIIVPAAIREAVRAAAEANGHGPDNVNVPLSATGQAPITHYGTRTWASDSFLAELQAYPAEMLAVSIIDRRDHADRAGHWDAVLAENGLQRVIEE